MMQRSEDWASRCPSDNLWDSFPRRLVSVYVSMKKIGEGAKIFLRLEIICGFGGGICRELELSFFLPTPKCPW